MANGEGFICRYTIDTPAGDDERARRLAVVVPSVRLGCATPVVYDLAFCSFCGGPIDGEVDFDEFLEMMTSRLAGSDTKEDIQKIFELFDDDKTGYISLQNLKRVAHELGENMDDAELLEMIERADLDHDGQISSEEFFTIMTQKTFG